MCSLAVTIESVLLAVFAVIGLVQAFRYCASGNRLSWGHSTLVSGACAVVSCWLSTCGLLGLRL